MNSCLKFFCSLVALLNFIFSFAAPPAKLVPVQLKCELRTNPAGVDVTNPDFSFILKAVNEMDKNLLQTAYEVMVAGSLAQLQKNDGDLWNSGKVSSDKMAFIRYEGRPLRSSQKYWWKVRVWDNAGNVSAWSNIANFTMGLLNKEDWTAKWITAAGAEKFSLSPFGYRAISSPTQTSIKWVQVDLQKTTPLSSIKLVPMFFEDRAGYGFPQNFKIEIADNQNFAQAIVIADYTTTGYPNPGWKPQTFSVKNVSGRYVRVTANKLWGRNNNYQFALRQIEVMAEGKNIASGKPVTAFDSNETEGWNKQNLTDEPEDRRALPNYSSVAIRKDFSVSKGLVRAVVHISGMSEYELTLNGKKVGDYLLSPGWTEYKKTILYNTYDVTKQLQTGSNAMGIILGNGMYNIQPDSVRYVKFLNSYGPLKAIAQLHLQFSDGSEKIIGTDDSWQVAPGPITYTNMFGGEDYDANLEAAGWNKPFFKRDKKWNNALITISPGGILKGLSADAPSVKIIEVKQPVSITQLKKNVWIYDYGQNASMMVQLTVSGPKGSYVRMMPSELLGKDGYVDRRSATQDGARPAWWQYTLAGKGVETWEPKFFYQGGRYLQVEIFPATDAAPLPQIKKLEDLIVHSSSTPIGKFASSNKLFNNIYSLVRWAQRSNMMSYMTDCPHREKMGWLEENHLNGPSLRYNFDMALLFRKTMNDMADAQLENGFVPNIAPEYFIAGPPDLSNNFRNSPEWGSSFIIIPWQQYLFSGDVSLLQRYYDKMKNYVAFLSSTAKNNIIPVGLGDWYDIGPKPAWGSQLTPVAFTATAIYYYDNYIMQQIAKVLGKEDDVIAYTKKAGEIRQSFNKEFFNEATGLYATGSNTTCAMPLFFNLVEPQNRTRLLTALVDSIRQRNNSFTSGEVGFRFLLMALSNGGFSNVVYDMNNQSEKPGYGYQIKMGATSLTEKWDAGVGDFGSQNHFMSGQINEWLFNNLAGISTDPNGPGFRKIIIKPSVVGDLTWVKGSFASISGDISCEWKIENGQLHLYASVPPNTTATIYVPAKKQTDRNKNLMKDNESKFIRYENGYGTYQVGSGNYHFSSAW